MTLYRYKALGKEGRLEKGVLEVSSSLELKTHLHDLGWSLITYSRDFSFFSSQSIKLPTLIDLCLHLEQFERAGIPLNESLKELSDAQSSPRLKAILNDLIADIQGGHLLSKALAKYPSVFDSVFISLISVGEKSGQLSFIFHQLFQHLKWIDEVRAQTFKALRYPFLVALCLLGVILILMTTLVPELISFIKNFSSPLPLSTRFLIAFSDFFADNLFSIFGVCGGIYLFLFIFLRSHPKAPSWKDACLNSLPLIGPLRRKIALTRFCHIFTILFESGIDILQALYVARRSLYPGQMYTSFESIEIGVKEGLSLSKAFQKVEVFPPMFIHMVKIGEKTSSLPKTLLHAKAYLDTTLKRQVDHMIGLIEPLIILGIGLLSAALVCSVFLPLYDTLSTLDY